MNSSGAAPVPPSVPSTTTKSGQMPVSSIALQIARNSHGWPTQSLKPTGLPPHARRMSPDQAQHFDRGRERRMARRRDAVHADRHAPDGGDLGRDFGGRQDPAMARLGALAELDLNHLDLFVGRHGREFFGAEGTVRIAAAEIAGADLPDDVAAVLAMIRAKAALPGIVRKAALAGAAVQGADGVGAERPEAHGRNVEDRGRIGLGAIGTADPHAERLGGDRLGSHRMTQPFVAVGVDLVLRAERTLVEHHLGALIDHRALVAAERHAVLLALEEVLPHLRPDAPPGGSADAPR